MKREAIVENLTKFLERNRPLVALKGDTFFVIRNSSLLTVTSNQLRIGDIRLLQLPTEHLIKGLSASEWTVLVSKLTTLHNLLLKSFVVI